MQYNFDERGKIFVGGLSWDTTHGTMLKYFSRYGEVIDCVVMKNQSTGKSRGFGFVTFKDPAWVDAVLAAGPHLLDGRQIDPKSCNPRSMNMGGKSAENSRKKIFIGGLPISITEEELKEQFTAFGHVSEVVIMYDQQKHKSRGFGFLTFECEETVDRVIEEHYIQVGGKQVEVKRAEPRDMKTIADSSSYTSIVACVQPQQRSTPTNQHPVGGTQVVSMTNYDMGMPIAYSPMPSPYCHNSTTLVAQCFQNPGLTYTIGLADQCPGLPLVGPIYSPSWVRCGPDAVVAATQTELFGNGGARLSPRMQLQPAPSQFNHNGDVHGTMYALSTIGGHCASGLGYASAAQFGLMETGDCEMMSKPMAAAASSATTYHRFAFGDYGLGLCSMMATSAYSGCGDSVHLGFIDPTISPGRISTYHSMASQGFHPYKR